MRTIDNNQNKHKQSVTEPSIRKTTSPIPVEEQDDHFDICQNACSTMDCTGLIPSLAQDEELEAYQELYDFLPKTVNSKKTDAQ